jgi:hypothetical protein
MFSYDPDRVPNIDPAVLRQGLDMGLHPVQIICEEKENAKPGDQTGVSFIAFVPFVPRIGEDVKLEDGKVCRVRAVYYRVVTNPDSRMITLVPNVVAILKPGQ